MLAKSKLNSTETLVSQALIDMETSHEEFNAIIREKQKNEKMKENIRNVSEKQENMRLNSVNSPLPPPKKKLYIYEFVNMRLVKKHWTFTPSKHFIFYVCMYKMVDISKKAFENNDIEVILDGISMLWLNWKHVEEKLGHKKNHPK